MCIDLHQTGSVGAGSDHLQLIKFWWSCAPGKGVCGGAKIFGAQCLRLSERFFIMFVLVVAWLGAESWRSLSGDVMSCDDPILTCARKLRISLPHDAK